MKPNITKLALLNEGDKFLFVNENGSLKTERAYFVEGQYPKFKCTTVFAEKNIQHNVAAFDGEIECKNITGVENSQKVMILEQNVLHVEHGIFYSLEHIRRHSK